MDVDWEGVIMVECTMPQNPSGLVKIEDRCVKNGVSWG